MIAEAFGVACAANALAGHRNPDLRLMPFKFDVQALVDELNDSPELWNEFDLRTNHPQSPHREMDDIFVRYNARANFAGDRDAFNGPHDSVWWDTIEKIPSVLKIVWELMREVQGERLGMVLITRQPPVTTCYPHVDKGWHAGHYDKYAVQLQSSLGQSFHVGERKLHTVAGDCFWFDNSKPHWVLNPTDQSRMTMIVCIRNRFTGVA
jgi:hypothetical protein